MHQAVHSTQNVSQLIKLDCKRLESDAYMQKVTHFTVSKKLTLQNSCGATWRHRPHTFLAVGAIAPMESAPMPFTENSGIRLVVYVNIRGK